MWKSIGLWTKSESFFVRSRLLDFRAWKLNLRIRRPRSISGLETKSLTSRMACRSTSISVKVPLLDCSVQTREHRSFPRSSHSCYDLIAWFWVEPWNTWNSRSFRVKLLSEQESKGKARTHDAACSFISRPRPSMQGSLAPSRWN